MTVENRSFKGDNNSSYHSNSLLNHSLINLRENKLQISLSKDKEYINNYINIEKLTI